MMKSVAGTYQNGKVELLEPAPEGAEGNVIVTFLANSHSVDLGKRGISSEQARDLRQRLSTFEEDWSQPEMDVYDADPPR